MEHPHTEHPETHHTTDGHLHDHEHSDIDIRGVLISVLIFLGSTALIMVVLAVVMRSFYHDREQRAEALRPARYEDQTGQFPNPRLQGNPTTDMVKLRADANAAVSRYEWDAADRVAHIPLDRALEIVASRGLPTRGPAKAEAPKPESPKPEAPEAEAPKAEVSKPEPVPTDTPSPTAPEEPKKAP